MRQTQLRRNIVERPTAWFIFIHLSVNTDISACRVHAKRWPQTQWLLYSWNSQCRREEHHQRAYRDAHNDNSSRCSKSCN